MCTVTFIPFNNKVYITSNRDEHATRQQALAPQVYNHIMYPKDAAANGTWIAANQQGNAIVLLNGAFEKHVVTGNYRKSRGLIVLDIFNTPNPYETFAIINLQNIEPFTIVLWQNQQLFECRWSGSEKFSTQLNHREAHIWQSVTLYNPTVTAERKAWFTNWLQQKKFTQQGIMNFHLFTGAGNKENNLVMNRNNNLFTVSITQIEVTQNNTTMYYNDILANSNTIVALPISTVAQQQYA